MVYHAVGTVSLHEGIYAFANSVHGDSVTKQRFYYKQIKEVSEKLDNFSDTGINTAISWFFEKKHEIAKAVQEVTDFLDSPFFQAEVVQKLKFPNNSISVFS
jgi:hypothetical protein